MLEQIDEKVSMLLAYNKEKGVVKPHLMRWKNRYIPIKEVTYHHLVKSGRELTHVFHVTDGAMDYRLHLNTLTLHWKLVEVSDGNS